MPTPEDYLSEREDGLTYRISQEYARFKLYALQAYLQITLTAMRKKNWYALNYIDLQSGPGKNKIGDQIYLGSPLIALTTKASCDNYWFNELDVHHFNSLKQRVSASERASQVHYSQEDANSAVDVVMNEIETMDKHANSLGKWSTFNIAFLDPEGLEINWETVEKLASAKRMDLIINFSVSGINRNLHNPEVLNRYFGNNDWSKYISGSFPARRREWINLYRKQLERFDYHVITDEETGHQEIRMRNSKNAEVYCLVFASKHPLGDDFWKKVKAKIDEGLTGQKPLF